MSAPVAPTPPHPTPGPGGSAPSGGTAYPASVRSGGAWFGLAARLVLGGVMLVAGLLKVSDLTGSVQNVIAYQLFPYEVSRLIGIVLPIIEIALGVLLLAGLLTRAAAAAVGALLITFVGGIVSAWARGLSIDCGCFGTGGPVAPGDTAYLGDIIRDAVLLLLALWLVLRPRTPFSLDHTLWKGR